VFLSGSWDERGAHVASETTFTYSCASGVIAKCVGWGYRPEVVGADLHQTCTRLARADYCGDGISWTRNGTLVNLYDDLGIQTSDVVPGMTFEAAWGVNGAVCRNEMRYRVLDADGQPIEPHCWSQLPRCDSFAEGKQLGAIMAVDSAHAEIAACEQ
jgi:hypothetical protein